MKRHLFGFLAKDKITGFTGIVTGYCDYMTGCAQWLITPKAKEDGTIIDPRWYDDGRIELVSAKPVITISQVTESALTKGADVQAPIR
jgi:hypothetical protein